MSYLPYALNEEWEQFTTIDWKKDFVQNSQKVTEYAKSRRKKDEGYNNRNVFSLTIKLSMLVSK